MFIPQKEAFGYIREPFLFGRNAVYKVGKRGRKCNNVIIANTQTNFDTQIGYYRNNNLNSEKSL
jgi:hypothetical protein